MIKSVLSKMANNIWLFICLTLGSLLITSVLSSIPIYTDGALRKMLNSELVNFQYDTGNTAGEYYTRINLASDYSSAGALDLFDTARDKLHYSFDNNNIPYTDSYESGILRLRSERGNGMIYTTQYQMRYMTGMLNHIDIIEGRRYRDSFDGVYEAIISEQAYNSNVIHLNQVYYFGMPLIHGDSSPAIAIRFVGVFRMHGDAAGYFYDSDEGYPMDFFVSPESFKAGMFTYANAQYVTSIEFYHNIEFRDMDRKDLNRFNKVHTEIKEYLKTFESGHKELYFPLNKTIVNFVDKGWEMELTMWVFNAPIIIMLAYYLFMVSKLIIEEDKNEISSLRSRGATSRQIFSRYIIECGIIIGFSLILGPPLGLVLAQVIGSANGFLEFVNRSGLVLRLVPAAYLYALLAGVLFMVMVLIPAYTATRSTIVQHKQKKARKNQKPFWEKAFLDFIFLGISIYLLITYTTHGQMVLKSSGSVDPSIYFISTLFIISAGLVFMRIYPYILKLIFGIFKRRMSPPVYATFVQVSRGTNDNRFLIMFLIMTVSIGIYSSASARIINNNVEEVAAYKCGADLVISPDWGGLEDNTSAKTTSSDITRIPLSDYMTIGCFENFTQVSEVHYATVKGLYDFEWYDGIRVMAIQPYEFSQVVDFRSGLLDTHTKDVIHWYHYINLMQDYPTAVLVSRGVADMFDLVVGSTLEVDINAWGTPEDQKVPVMNCYVLAIFDYWPNYYDGAVNTDVVNQLVVMNYSYLNSVKANATYNMWIDLKDGTTKDDVLNALKERGLEDGISAIRFKTEYISRGKGDSTTMALNGSLSMGFVATMMITLIGFLLYWIMNMRKRKLQFGILRAMGLSRGKTIFMLALEQLLTTGVAVLVGIFLGNLATRLFMPILSQTYISLLPLHLTYSIVDTLRIMAVVLVMIIIGLVVLGVFIKKLKINEAVKIGEE
ncbi:MAG: ABC transporter permease [Clostridia bacterium]|nr:ABC transporter permease [Clostridia bacterium]